MSTLKSREWSVFVQEPGDEEPHEVGPRYGERAHSVWYRDRVLKPRVGKGMGYKKHTKFFMVRTEVLQTFENTSCVPPTPVLG